MRFVLLNEDGKPYKIDRGSYTFNPGGHKDPATKWGVIQSEYEKFLGKSLTPEQVSEMTRDTALQLYRAYFWDVIHGDDYATDAEAVAIMDTAVNKGIGGCMSVLIDALNAPNIHYYRDAVALLKGADTTSFLAEFEPALLRYINHRIAKLPQDEWAREGWDNRAAKIVTIPHFLEAL